MSTDPHATHTFSGPGTYTVQLTVTDNKGATTTTSQAIVVSANKPPVASFTWAVAADANKTWNRVDFDASASTDPDGTIVKYDWDFQQSVFSSASPKAPGYIYNTAGTFIVKLTVTDNLGATGTVTNLVTVAAQPVANQPPSASFVATSTNLTANFDGSASTDPDGTIASYAWSFGDGTTGSGVTAAHTYSTPNTYTVGLTVTDNLGLSATKTKSVTVASAIGGQPSGPGIVQYQNLSGATPSAKINSAGTANKVSFPASTIQWSDFKEGAPTAAVGFGLFANTVAGLLGTSRDGTILGMVPGSSSKQTSGSTTGLQYLALNPSCKLVQDLTVQGTPTGANAANSLSVYNGFFLNSIDNFVMNRVKIKAIPGSGHVPPYETFAIDGYHGSNHTFNYVEIDGAGVGATAFGPNYHTGTYTLNDCYAHDNKWSCGLAAYQCSGTIQVNRFRSVNNYHALNFEQNADGTIINVVSPRVQGTGSQVVYIGAYTGSVKLTITDPTDDAGKPLTTMTISCSPLYGGKTNTQKRSDIKILVGGVDKTSSIVQWS